MRTVIGHVGLGLVALVSLGACSSGNHAAPSGAAGAPPSQATGNGSDASAGGGSAGQAAGGGSAGSATGGAPSASGGAGSAGSGGDAGGSGGSAGVPAGSDGGAGTTPDAGPAVARLVPWEVDSDGSPPLVMGIYDQQEKVHCRFLLDETGQLRCLPIANATFAQTAWFSDAACTKRIYDTAATFSSTWTDHPTAVPLPRIACEAQRYAVATLKTSPGGAPHFGGTPCAQVQPSVQLPFVPYGQSEVTVAEAQAPDRWQTGLEVDGPRIGNRMRVKVVAAPDGARFVDSFVDEHWSRPCHLVANGDDVYCQGPAALAIAGMEGATCAGRPVWRAHACDDPAFLLQSAGTSPRAFDVGPAWTGPVSTSGHGCRVVSGTSTVDGPDLFFETGASITEAIMTSQPWQPAGTGRLRLRGLVDDDGNVATFPSLLLWSEYDGAVIVGAHARYFDATANVTCNPIRTPEGQLRCVPTTTALVEGNFAFADSKCTQPAFNCPNYMSTCPGIVAMKASLQANGEVLGQSLSTTLPVTTLFVGSGTSCMQADFGTLAFFTLGPDAPWTQFPAFSERNGRASDGL
jgi:hypothetical protein